MNRKVMPRRIPKQKQETWAFKSHHVVRHERRIHNGQVRQNSKDDAV